MHYKDKSAAGASKKEIYVRYVLDFTCTLIRPEYSHTSYQTNGEFVFFKGRRMRELEVTISFIEPLSETTEPICNQIAWLVWYLGYQICYIPIDLS